MKEPTSSEESKKIHVSEFYRDRIAPITANDSGDHSRATKLVGKM